MIMNEFVKNKVFAFDLDGTLVNSDKIILDSTKRAIKELIDNGAHIVLASGRIYEGIYHLAEELELDKYGGYICSYNGGLVTNILSGENVFDRKLSKEKTLEIHKYLKENGLTHIMYYDGIILTTDEINEYIRNEEKCNNIPSKKVDSFEPYIQYGVNKLLGTDDPKKIKEMEEKVKKHFDDIEVYTSAPYFLELLPKGIYKSESLKMILKSLNLDTRDLISFGDGNNDIAMLDASNIAIVMDNASENVKKHASYITHSCDEDGISYAIKKIMSGELN